jgi:hypothetical protein
MCWFDNLQRRHRQQRCRRRRRPQQQDIQPMSVRY